MNQAIAFAVTAAASSLAFVFALRLARLHYFEHPPGLVLTQTIGAVYVMLVGLGVQEHGWDITDIAGLLLAAAYAYKSRERVYGLLHKPAHEVIHFCPRTCWRNGGESDGTSGRASGT